MRILLSPELPRSRVARRTARRGDVRFRATLPLYGLITAALKFRSPHYLLPSPSAACLLTTPPRQAASLPRYAAILHFARFHVLRGRDAEMRAEIAIISRY